MGSALWLLLALPEWYFSALLYPLAGGLFTAIPAFGTICLLIGAVIGLRSRRCALLLFLIPFGLSELLVAAAGVMRGRFADGGAPIALVFLGVQLLLILILIWRLRHDRVAALLLSAFSLSYALFAGFVASMAFADNWI